MEKVTEKINSLEIYKVGESGYDLVINSLNIVDTIYCENKEKLLKEIERLLPDLKEF